MLFKAVFLTGLAASHAVAQRVCGAPEPTEEEIAIAKSFYEVEKEARLAGNATSAAATIVVNTYFHVLATSNSAAGGYLTVRGLLCFSFVPVPPSHPIY